MPSNEVKWTLDDVEQTLLDNADYVETQSLAKAKAFVSAATRWLIMRPLNASAEGRNVAFNVQQVQAMKDNAEQFVEQSQTGGVRFIQVENYRG